MTENPGDKFHPTTAGLPEWHDDEVERIVTDAHRTMSDPPVDYETDDPRVQVLGVYERLFDEASDDWRLRLQYPILPGSRIVVADIPYYDFQTGAPAGERELQIYRNSEGFLVADKVVGGEGDKHLARRPPMQRLPSLTNDNASVLMPDTSARPERSINDKKIDYPDGTSQLTTTTFKYPARPTERHPFTPGAYNQCEIIVSAPQGDQGDQVEIYFRGGPGEMPPRIMEPVRILAIPDVPV
jgi:hypothetical protein